jgi:hypothetical protein
MVAISSLFDSSTSPLAKYRRKNNDKSLACASIFQVVQNSNMSWVCSSIFGPRLRAMGELSGRGRGSRAPSVQTKLLRHFFALPQISERFMRTHPCEKHVGEDNMLLLSLSLSQW